MRDIIKLLPDSVANQIAAGEVIQRPASAIKELMENAIDAGASRIQVVVKDAGKSFMQVIDDGQGMSETDARLSFERHATSKINQANDLFAIRTMGFRGEALASIAAVAMVEMKTRLLSNEVGTELEIAGSKVESQQPTACPTGTSITIKNLFFNIPARRNFLKSNASETRHIVEEFQRVALSYPEKSFSLTQDGVQVFNLSNGNLKQRITGIFGNGYNERIVPIQEDTTILKIEGFIGKPEFGKKTRGEQFLFVNRRFIKSSYINHAISDAFDDLLPLNTFPSYFLFIEIDPSKIDINIHPTKTEIKFEDEKSVYAIIRAATKRALGKFSISPSLDFDQETAFNIPVSMYGTMPKQPEVKVDRSYNPFQAENNPRKSTQGWENLYIKSTEQSSDLFEAESTSGLKQKTKIFGQFALKYILVSTTEGLLLIDQKRAHERILYDRHAKLLNQAGQVVQQDLFPLKIEFSTLDAQLLKEMEPELKKIGFDLSAFGGSSFVLNGVPSGTERGSEKRILEAILESYKNQSTLSKDHQTEKILRSVSTSIAIKYGVALNTEEMEKLVNDLFECEAKEWSPTGKKTFKLLTEQDLQSLF
ncbi:MAG: DNA mismatch repair endonuclease MutL [Bacteroidota bacterium]